MAEWLKRIAGAAANAGPAEVSWPFLPISAVAPGLTADDGLKALTHRSPQSALSTWRRLIDTGAKDPNTLLFASMLLRTSRNWLEYKTPSPFDRAVFAEAVHYCQKACTLDSRWPDAWLEFGEWLSVAALAEGIRQTVGTGDLFSLDDMLDGFQIFGLAVECFRKASELDDGRLRHSLSSFAYNLLDHTARDIILESAGKRAKDATVRHAVQILRGSGVDDSQIRVMPSDEVLIDEVRAIRRRGEFLVFITPLERFDHFANAFAVSEMCCHPKHAFGPTLETISNWYTQALEDGIALVASRAVACNPWNWFQMSRFERTAIRCVDVHRFSLFELVGTLTWTSPDATWAAKTDRIWYAAP